MIVGLFGAFAHIQRELGNNEPSKKFGCVCCYGSNRIRTHGARCSGRFGAVAAGYHHNQQRHGDLLQRSSAVSVQTRILVHPRRRRHRQVRAQCRYQCRTLLWSGRGIDQTNITDDTYPIYDRDNLNWREGGNERGNDPIGYLRWIKDPDGASGGHPGKDYSVIEFVDGVNLSSQGQYLKMTGIHELPSGTISSPYATAPAQPREKVLGTGVFTNHTLIHASAQTGVQYSRITSNQAAGIVGVYQSGASMQAGDSGGPAIIKDASAQLPSAANGYQTQGKWVGIVRGTIINYPIYSYTSSANILADLRTRDLASGQDGSVVGAGFEVTTNP